ncbi:uncharacterized protein BDR25DRAFT_320447 [Lindgomyces ingoldianus]|uniref:Uncharacterized protein n=1 Tax=Lindgomyces ingoldianus TaxID=673940 RepID=A0ACB6Q9K7_9PLEO|nr:uncharacterized protein BDR25DRAFT_320447 [Lindgomyces ingoldianus]KAF2462831.1 hypothetical protein BDR25DRAFT_320447 [Lindgomyces ingoldianus]
MTTWLRNVIAAVASVAVLVIAQPQSGGCDRSCLESLMSEYLTAIAAHDPKRLPTAPGVKYVENQQIVPLGEGEWLVASSPGKYRHVFADPEANEVGAITTLKENGVGTIYIARLKINDDRKITEIETQITRDPIGAARYENMTQPEAVWLEAVPLAQRISRDRLITQSNKYYTGMERNDPKGNYSFFDKDCNRLEDGLNTTNQRTGDPYGHSNDTAFASLGCEAQFQTGFLGFVTKIRDRRFLVDEERQVVLSMTILDHNSTVRELPSVNGTSSPIPAYFDVPRTLQATEGFRLKGDKLFRIEMTLTENPYGMRSAFVGSPLPPVSSQDTSNSIFMGDPCDRICLSKVLDQVLQAMLVHNASTLPLAQGVRYSENGQFIDVGDGLWLSLRSFSKPGVDEYAAQFADPTSGTAGYWGLTKEHTTPGVLALRIRVDSGKITEIEANAVRAESSGSRFGTMTLMRPPLPVEWESDPLGPLDPVFLQNGTGATATSIPSTIMTSYFDGLEQHSSTDTPFTTSCLRRDNGVQGNLTCAAQMAGHGVSPNGLYNLTSTVRDRRVLVTDAEKGVVMVVAMIDNTATGPGSLPVTASVPSTYLIPQLIKVDNGAISRVEGMVKWMPYGYSSAWTEEKGF